MNCPAGAREAGLGHAPAAPFYRVSPCGASFFPSDGKETKGSPGDAAGANFVRHVGVPYPLWPFGPSPPDRGSRPPDPHYGGYPFGRAKNFRRAKSEWLLLFHSGPLGPGFLKIETGAVLQPRLDLPNQRYRSISCRRGAHCAPVEPSPLKGEGAPVLTLGRMRVPFGGTVRSRREAQGPPLPNPGRAS